jgi:hypothetical protein
LHDSAADQRDIVAGLCVWATKTRNPAAASERLEALKDIPRLPVDERAMLLAEQLASALALPARARLDAAHIAIAAIHRMEFLLSWNCRHLANAALASKIEQTCIALGQVAPRIVTPEQLLESP